MSIHSSCINQFFYGLRFICVGALLTCSLFISNAHAQTTERVLPQAFSQQVRLTADDGAANDNFGNAVAISGNTAIIGANRQVSQNDKGAAYIFVRTGATTWAQQQKLLGADVVNGDVVGTSVAIDGDTAVVGAPIHRVNNIGGVGAVYVFVRNGTTWTQQQQLTASDGALNNQFGSSVAINGNTIMVGEWMATVGGNLRQGAVYVFTRRGTTWTQQQKLTASGGLAADELGTSIAMTNDRMVVGALQNNFGATGTGAAFVFVRNGTSWSQEQKLTASDGASLDAFGNSVSISSSGDTIAVGAFHDDDGAVADRGAAYVFVRSGTTWSQQQKLQGSLGINNGFGNEFGTAVAVNGDIVFVGAPSVNFVAGGGRGGIYEFDRTGTAWTETSRIGSPTIVISNFGCALSMSGAHLAVGSSTDTVGTTLGEGSAYIFANGSQIQFGAWAYSVNEGDRAVVLKLERTGDVSGAGSVFISTHDSDNFTLPCSETVLNQGSAFGRCDYATVVGFGTFLPGEFEKQLFISIIDDAIVESDESFTVNLGPSTINPTALGAPATSTVTILDNDVPAEPNPILTTAFFVRQNYLDFLSREPEQGEPWSAILNNCPDVNNDPACDRITVSGDFFGSPEFQLKGFFVYRFYKLAFNRLPEYSEIVGDMASVTGTTPAEVFQLKASFTNSFVQRTEFTNNLGALTNAQYVTTLMSRYALTQVTTPDPAQPDGTNKVTLTTTDLTNQLNASTLTRAQVLRAIADSDQVNVAEFNKAFVAMQYYGYLRRTPETAGYNAWLDYLNTHPTDSRTMVNGFMNSAEYKARFGSSQ